MTDFEVRGADQFLRLSKALKLAGATETRKALHKGLRDAVNREKPTAARALADALPSGLARKGTKVRQSVLVKTGADPGVTVGIPYGRTGSGKGTTSAIGGVNAQLLNKTGTFRHPVFKTGRWVAQSAPGTKDWFDKTWTNKAPQVRDELERVLNQVSDDIVRKARH